MGERTGISWTDSTWNFLRGCSREVAEGATTSGCGDATGGGCYAEALAGRFCGPGMPFEGLVRITANGPRWTGRVAIIGKHLLDPLRWQRPRRIFVASVSDSFHRKLSNEEIAGYYAVMWLAGRHTFQNLTKRARRRREWFAWAGEMTAERLLEYGRALVRWVCPEELATFERAATKAPAFAWPLPNVWEGASVEHQAAADERIPELLQTPAAVRFISCEPLLGEIDLDIPRCDYDTHADDWGVADDGTPWCMRCDSERSYGHWLHLDGGIDWVIAGCESGRNARPCSVEWLRLLRDQCRDADVPFFLKQAMQPGSEAVGDPLIAPGDRSKRKPGGLIELPYLDGVQHAAFPEVR